MIFAIETEGLTRIFNGLRAVDNLNLQVKQGTIFGFLGPNGAGKTTTIRLLLGLVEPSAGRATVLGYRIPRQAPQMRERVGVLLEHDGLYLRLTAYDNLDLYGDIYRVPRTERRQRIEELLRRLDLWERRNERAGTFSKGMRHKLAMARAVLHRPPLIFLDEPTAGLDPVSAVSLRREIVNLARNEGTTVFLTTHNLAEAERICDYVGVIRRGQLITVDSPGQLRARAVEPRLKIIGRNFTPPAVAAVQQLPRVKNVTVDNGQMMIAFTELTDTAPVVALLVQHGVAIEEARKGGISLEQVFVTLIEEGQ